jgi:hypothetical protein
MWIVLLPRLGGYQIVEEILELGGGARTGRLVRKYASDAEPERAPLLGSESGRPLVRRRSSELPREGPESDEWE